MCDLIRVRTLCSIFKFIPKTQTKKKILTIMGQSFCILMFKLETERFKLAFSVKQTYFIIVRISGKLHEVQSNIVYPKISAEWFRIARASSNPDLISAVIKSCITSMGTYRISNFSKKPKQTPKKEIFMFVKVTQNCQI